MEKFGFHKVSNKPGPGNPTINHNQPVKAFKRQFRVDNCPNNSIALGNTIGVNPADIPEDLNYVIVDNMVVYSITRELSVKPGTVGMAGNVRQWGRWSLNQPVTIADFSLNSFNDNFIYIKSAEIFIDYRSTKKQSSNPINHNELIAQFLINYNNQILQATQPIVMDFKGQFFSLYINSIQLMDMAGKPTDFTSSPDAKGILTGQAEVDFYPHENSIINLVKDGNAKSRVSNKPRSNPIINPDFKLDSLGIGGLDNEFQQIFRRAFASRIISPDLVNKLGLRHVKGLLLFGPPGTGKTLIARQIGKMLNVKEPKIVNGPEMLSKFVGASEENIRNLFKDAEQEYKQKGDSSGLHIIIFDELDSVFKQRGNNKSDGTGVGDNVVNQLLAKMDGVDQLNNILIIGMTNRLDLIDNALLRPGRFEIQIEISLPDEKGRHEILLIHTKKMKNNNLLDDDIDFQKLAKLTKNFTGAELEGLVNSATSFAINNYTKSDSLAKVDENISKMKLTWQHFELALNEVRPAFGVNEENLSEGIPYGVIRYNEAIERILDMGRSYINEVSHSENERLISVLFHGKNGVGKTAIATMLSLESKFPFIKVLNGELLVGMNELMKINTIDNLFRDIYKSPLSVLIIDKVESIINYVPIGPRFSNDILQMLMVYLTRKPPNGRRLLILATTSQHSILKSMNLVDCFTKSIEIKPVTDLVELQIIMNDLDFMSENERLEILNQLQRFDQPLSLGIKKLLQVLMNAKFANLDVNGVVENLLDAQT
ncbi:transport between ER and Golgi ATPase protein [Yamadazyma tenuis]|uniref:Vesicular-fusion protein SEC18 n=1 Tax=Candida tenuis (strain ATCC 10573 / BCRC 21748 / CBS 615 / JCM 9827 / NBRC 10315 / NRRL Y-1498 / VKM Y-70) TaxID=590646 RepID=G3B447_CANTC|nr:AAA-domain-containing protein [Yamadazyma tenuis ATCC 10573]EGV63774.1 AAA-domain-containing protein [Yamadazyma tenuis ATCC 10573]WEJ96614.1 transport between ER and Golgi ATPase protein [Yamadazyma tenuis]